MRDVLRIVCCVKTAGYAILFVLLAACAANNAPPAATPTAAAPPAASLPTANPTLMVPPTSRPTQTIAPPASAPAWPVITRSATLTPTAAATPGITPSPTATPLNVNGIPVNQIVIMPPDVQENVRRIYALGQELGRNPQAFSKLGDSAVLTSHYLTRFDDPTRYNLGEYTFLQPVIEYYAGSFRRYAAADALPNRGLGEDGVHLSISFTNDYTNPAVLDAGYPVSDLTALFVLDAIRQVVEGGK